MALEVEFEVTLESEPCVAAWDDKLFVGTEDGSIKSFDAKLTPGAPWSAHAAQIFALAAKDGKVYSSSNDGGVRVWSSEGQKIAEMPLIGGDIGTLHVFDKHIYAGDEDGNVILYENNTEKAKYNVLEEVKDLWLQPPFLFTVRDLDVTVTEIKPEESKTRFVTRHTLEGRAPLGAIDNRLLVIARGGNNLRLHDISIETAFKLLHEIKVSDMIITSMSVSGAYVWTAGWDGYVRRWKIVNDKFEAAGEVEVGCCVNALAVNSYKAFAALAGGKVVCIKSV